MLIVNFIPYIMGNVVNSIILLGLFFNLYDKKKDSSKKQLIVYTLLFFVVLFLDISFSTMVELVDFIVLYLSFKTKKYDSYLISVIVTSLLISDVISMLITLLIKSLNLIYSISNDNIIILSIFFQITILSLTIFIIKKLNLKSFLKEQNDLFLNILLCYSFLVIYFLGISVQYFKAYFKLITYIIIFVLIQMLFLIVLFIFEKRKQKEIFEKKLIKSQVKNLKNYTDQLEHDQLKLRRFKHDYKNLLRSLEINAYNNNDNELIKSIKSLGSYSDKYLNNISTELYRDIGNIKIPFLKSLFIDKLSLIVQKEINCSFECRYEINQISINEFDLIRILGISMDNAIESVQGVNNGSIKINIVQTNNEFICSIINNTSSRLSISKMSQVGFSTKKSHSGLGISTVNEINKKYPNLLIDYSNSNGLFSIQITIVEA